MSMRSGDNCENAVGSKRTCFRPAASSAGSSSAPRFSVKRGMRRSTSVSVKFSPVSQFEMPAKSCMLAGLLREVAITSEKRLAL